METMAMMAVDDAGSGAGAAEDFSWQEDLVQRWTAFHSGVVTTADGWLDYAASVDLTSTSAGTSTGEVDGECAATWSEVWRQFTTFGGWPEWSLYHQTMMDAFHDGVKGVQSVSFWLWLTIQPLLRSFVYLAWKIAQVVLGTLLPQLQYAIIEVCRFHIHLTWRQALGEAVLVGISVLCWKSFRHLRQKRYLERSKRYIRQTARSFKKTLRSGYRNIIDASLLAAMALPHVFYLGVAVMVKLVFPSLVTHLAMETPLLSIIKWWYPFVASFVVLHHARTYYADSAAIEEKNRSVSSPRRSTTEKTKKPKSKRRRSSIGALLRRTAPGHSTTCSRSSNGSLASQEVEEVIYTEEELNYDVSYWLNYWILYSSLLASYNLASKVVFVGSVVQSEMATSLLTQLELFFYIWIFGLPEALTFFFPDADEKMKRDWSASKQWCYECALQPVHAIPSLFLPLIVPFFERVSQAVTPEQWKSHVVDRAQRILDLLLLLKMLSEPRKDALLEYLTNMNTMVIPALTLLTPGIITQYGVWYVMYIVPQAHSFRSLASSRRKAQRVLYLKFWVLHGPAATLIGWLVSFFWLFPLCTHLTFVAWCVLVMPRVINFLYHEFDRELQSFGILPPVADDLSVENTVTFRTLSMVAAMVPKAADTEGAMAEAAAAATAAAAEDGYDTDAADAGNANAEKEGKADHNELGEKTSKSNGNSESEGTDVAKKNGSDEAKVDGPTDKKNLRVDSGSSNARTQTINVFTNPTTDKKNSGLASGSSNDRTQTMNDFTNPEERSNVKDPLTDKRLSEEGEKENQSVASGAKNLRQRKQPQLDATADTNDALTSIARTKIDPAGKSASEMSESSRRRSTRTRRRPS